MPSKEEIKAARVQENLTQREAADLVSVNLRTWEGYESGRRMPEAVWELFQLHTSTHPKYRLVRRKKKLAKS